MGHHPLLWLFTSAVDGQVLWGAQYRRSESVECCVPLGMPGPEGQLRTSQGSAPCSPGETGGKGHQKEEVTWKSLEARGSKEMKQMRRTGRQGMEWCPLRLGR